jgi:hypothetical protein
MREIALEERGVEIVVDAAPRGQPVVLVMPIDPAMVAALSYVRLLQMLDRALEKKPLVWNERKAAE